MPFSDLTPYQSGVLVKLVNLAKERDLTYSEFNVLRMLDRVKIRTSSFEELLVLEKEAESALKVLASRRYIDVTGEWEHGFKFVFAPRAFRHHEWVQKPVLRRRLCIRWTELPAMGRITIVVTIVAVIIPLAIAGIWNLWFWVLHWLR